MRKNKIMLIDEVSLSTLTESQWKDLGYDLVGVDENSERLDIKIREAKAELLVLCIERPNSALLNQLDWLHKNQAIPVIIFTQHFDKVWAKKLLAVGVSSYNGHGFEPIRIASILCMATYYFYQLNDLKASAQLAEEKLSNRILVDKAKGMLMEYQHISEPQAYRALQKTAMDQATTIVDVARQTIHVLKNIQGNTASVSGN